MDEIVFEAKTSPLSRLRQSFPSNHEDLPVGSIIRETPKKVFKEPIDVSSGTYRDFHIHHVVYRDGLQYMFDQ